MNEFKLSSSCICRVIGFFVINSSFPGSNGGLDFIRTRPEVPPRGPQSRTPTFWGSGQVGLSSIDLGVPRGRAPKVLRRTGQGSLEFIRTRPEVPPRGPRGGTPRFQGSGQVGVDSIRPRGVPGQGPEGP